MVAVRQKPSSQLANGRGGRGRAVVLTAPIWEKAPTIPVEKPYPRVKLIWDAFWRSKVSWAVDPDADAEPLTQWAEAMQRRVELWGRVEDKGYSGQWGPMGSLIPNPDLVMIKHLDREIARLREHFGMTPTSRFRLQLTISEAGLAADKLDRILNRKRKTVAAGTARKVNLD